MLNNETIIVMTSLEAEMTFLPPEKHELDLIYRDDGSLQIIAYSGAGYPKVLGEFAKGHWMAAWVQEV